MRAGQAPLRVLDLTDELAFQGARLLVGLGADVVRIEPMAGAMGPALVTAALTSAARTSAGPLPHGVYPAAGQDRWVAIAVQDQAQWRALAALIGQLPGDDAALAAWTPTSSWRRCAAPV